MEHVASLGMVVIVNGGSRADANAAPLLVISEHGAAGTSRCVRTDTHLHLVETDDIVFPQMIARAGHVFVDLGDRLVIDGTPHTWLLAHNGFALLPAS